MPDRERPGMMMPVSDEGAALQFFVEAMKQNTAVLQQVSKAMQGVQDEQKETLKLVHDTRERVIRIEQNNMNAQISDLEKEVAELRDDKLRREGASNLATGTLRNGPIIVTLVAALVLVITILIANGKLVL